VTVPLEPVGALVDRGLAAIQTGPFGTQLKASDYVEHGIPVINVRNVGYGWLRPEKLEFVSDATAERLGVHVLAENDIVFGRKGAVDRHLLVRAEQAGWMQGSDCIRLRFTGAALNPRYVSYAFLRSYHKEWMLLQCGNKATMASLNQDVIRRIELPLPSREQQDAIVSTLSAYDDLIENNRKRIALLEEAARLLYREWFVHLRFPGHEHVEAVDGVPEGWERGAVRTLLELRYGKALKESDRIAGLFPVYGSSGVVGTHKTALVEGPAIVVGRKGNVGSVYWSPCAFWPIDTVYYVPKEQSDFWLYLTLPSVGFQNTDAGVPGLNRDFAYSRKCLVPSQLLRRLFDETVESMFAQITTLENFNRKLAEARDLLLPRLMNGEIAV
jgi:type I restriction enzyme S subunit